MPCQWFAVAFGVLPLLAILGFAIINAVTFIAFGLDKARAGSDHRRIPEADLLALALFGGLLGAYTGRALFRHKTRKQPFSNNLHTIAFAHVIGLGSAMGWWLGG
jgi:uncharacterized membrane protein YsdA (DUF1294 family)